MRIAYLTNGFPYPLTSGYLRHYYLIRELARRHQITLLSVVTRSFTPDHARAMAPYTERVLTFTARRRGGSPLLKGVDRAAALLRGKPEIRQMRAAFHQLLRERPFDAVLLSGKPTYDAVAGVQLPVVADICDATSVRIRMQMRHATPWRRVALWLHLREACRAEREILRTTEHVVFASDRDRRALAGWQAEHTTVLPNGVDLDYWKRSTSRLGSDTLVFTGAMNYPPNEDAALHLIQEILPLVRRAVPGVQVLIVGHSPTPALVKARQIPGVTVTGFVDDVRPYLEGATVFVAPIRFAAGIQNKLLEALAMELPAVASPAASDGLQTESGNRPPIDTASTPSEFADAIVRQLKRRRENPAPATEGRRYIERHFSWSRGGERLNEIIERAVHARGALQAV